MNKLVIVGNGFDLAHGLPTSYKQFTDDFWKTFKDNYKNENISQLVFFNESYYRIFEQGEIENFDDFENNIQSYIDQYPNIRFDSENYVVRGIEQNTKFQNVRVEVFNFRNTFFKDISTKNSIENWVDIENEYYKKLKIIVDLASLDSDSKKKQVLLLNKEFKQVKNLLEEYLIREVNEKFNFTGQMINHERLISLFEVKPKYLSNNGNHPYLKEFPKNDFDELLRIDKMLVTAEQEGNLPDLLRSEEATDSTVFLNFNYTPSLTSYIKTLRDFCYDRINQIPIHGSLNDRLNPINFGFGDEMDEDYKLIENLDDNEYLENFKSFKYSQNSNYKNLLDYIDSDKFQVYIMGHSCGLSDRTLLNTIFEHDNCRSIKIFYHQREDGSDNSTEIVQNISRHFNDKKMMREKIVNKSLCVPLPQDIRFQEKA